MQVVEQDNPIARLKPGRKGDGPAVERGGVDVMLRTQLDREVLDGCVVNDLQDHRARALRRKAAKIAPQGYADLHQSPSFRRAKAIFSAVIGSVWIRTQVATAM